MPRQKRQISETNIYHVMARGNEKQDIFLGDADREKFMQTLIQAKKELNFILYAYCLMNNHYHLLLRDPNQILSLLMKKINTGFVMYFNKKYDRVGHLFQDRFNSEAINSDRHLLAAIRYIHNNPCKAKLVEKPEQYPWSSYNDYLGKEKIFPGIVDRDFILNYFSKDAKMAVPLFIAFSNTYADDTFLDFGHEEQDDKTITSIKDASAFVGEKLQQAGVTLDALKKPQYSAVRNDLIRELKLKSNLSIRQISALLGVGKSIVHRIN